MKPMVHATRKPDTARGGNSSLVRHQAEGTMKSHSRRRLNSRAHAALDVRARLLPEPCLWCWEIVDPGGLPIHSSWAAEWTAYASREEALAAGLIRLAELRSADAGYTSDIDRKKGWSVA